VRLDRAPSLAFFYEGGEQVVDQKAFIDFSQVVNVSKKRDEYQT